MTPPVEVRYRSLNHWRGAAALAVMFFHLFGIWRDAHPEIPGWIQFALFQHGWLGVELFFVISGYCIAERIARQHQTGGSVGGFWLDRAWRILPVYWVALALLLVIRLASAPFNHALPAAGLVDWLLAIPLLEPWLHRASVLTVSWSLACELFYYALAGLCLGLVGLTRRPWTGFAAAALLGLASQSFPLFASQAVWQMLPHFLLGVVVWGLVRGLRHIPRLAAGLAVCGAVAGLTWLPGALVGSVSLRTSAGFAFGLVVLHPWDARIARSRFLRPLGAIGVLSYSLYLVHVPFGSPLQNFLCRLYPPQTDTFAVVPLLACVLTLGFAWLFYRCVESPLEVMRHKYLSQPAVIHPS